MRLRHVWGTAGLVAALLATAGCQQAGTRTAADPELSRAAKQGAAPSTRSSDEPPAAPGTGSVQPVGLDPAHAVAKPGPRKGPVIPADLLIYNTDPLSGDAVAAIKSIKGVVAVEQMAMAQVQVQGKVLNIAAVDPASYRRYTEAGTADYQPIWDRVAAGEIAVLPSLRRKLGDDANGFLRLGNAADAPKLHIGAYANQVGQIDAVVNETYIDTLDMLAGNALLVSTLKTSPQSVQAPIEKAAGDGASVQALDAVARFGLDPSATQVAFLAGSVADAVGTFNYTVIGGGRVAPEPSWVSSHIMTAQVPILGTVTCNKAIFPQLTAALNEIIAQGLADKIHPGEYAGCYYPRFIAGTTSLSNHSFGLAFDVNTPGNQRGTVGEIDRGVVDAFKRWGFTWGGDWNYTDPMHFEMNRIIDPR